MWIRPAVVVGCMVVAYGDWVDPDTLAEHRAVDSYELGKRYELVFSDEFNVPNRDFHDGHDPKWTSINKNDYTNYAIHYYNGSHARTSDGYLNITTDVKEVVIDFFDTKVSKWRKERKYYQSGMVQGWNKFCFTGGIVEVSARLPGRHDIGGLWPAMWLLGNLARATYVGSSNNVWPWSYDRCDEALQPQQLISKCNKVNHYGLHSHQGRGAPEIDILEAMAGVEKLINTPVHRPYYSASLQLAPGTTYRPDTGIEPDYEQWYKENITYGANASLNIFFYGVQLDGSTPEKSYVTDAISANRDLDEEHFSKQHVYRMEWEAGPEGYIAWYLDGEFVYRIGAAALAVSGAVMPEEPMYLLLNTAISHTWGFPYCDKEDGGCPCECYDCKDPACDCALPNNMCGNFPAHFLIDYVRVYQNKQDPNQIVGCSTPSHPTRQFIQGHKWLYKEGKDTDVLKPVMHGGGRCKQDTDCMPHATYDGHCSAVTHRCICKDKAFTGPHCMAGHGFDDIIYDTDEPLAVHFAFIPRSLLLLILALLGGLVGAVAYKYVHDKQQRRSQVYMSIPDSERTAERLESNRLQGYQ